MIVPPVTSLVKSVLMVPLLVLVAACGSGSSSSASASPTPGPRNGATGELVGINGSKLTVSAAGASGSTTDTTVTTSSTTTVSKTSTGAISDLTTGQCVLAIGQADSTGAITARSITVTPPASDGTCSIAAAAGSGFPGGGGFGGGGGGFGGRSPGAATPSGSPGPRQFPGAQGTITAVNGLALTVHPKTGADVTVNFITTTPISKVSTASLADLAATDCVRVTGPRQSDGSVTATSITIVPAGPSGTCSTGFGGGGGRRGGGGGGFGGGNGGNGGGNGGAPPAGVPPPGN